MLHLGPSDSISAVMGGAAATTNPTVTVRNLLNGQQRSPQVALAGATPVVLLTGAGVTSISTADVEVENITIANVDTQANTITVSATIGAVTANQYVITMQAGDTINIDRDGNLKGVNSAGQALTQTAGGSTITFTTINAATATLAINGLAAAQGGTVAMTGGTSSTTGNAGGALTRTGGTPGATGIGGAVNDIGGAGGATSGAGGALTRVGGAGTAGNAAGGAITDTGGAGQGSAAGGAVNQVGGLGGATGAGGAIAQTGGAGGATSGTGGALTRVGGAGTAGNSAGGAIADTGGAGQGSAAGGACGQTGGAGGTTGAGGALNYISGAGGGTSGPAGAINITVGSATNAAGANLTMTAGNGASGTNGGGNINFIPGTAVSTGTPGEIQVNSAAGIMEVGWSQPLSTTACPASTSVVTFFLANRAYRVKAIRVRETTVGTSETFTFKKDPSGTAAGGGTAICTGAITLGGTTNNTPVAGTMSSTIANVTLAAGDSLSFTVGGTVGSAAGVQASALLVPV